MEDFIIILIGFALMIYSAYSKNKKAKKSRESYEDPASEKEASEDILEQFFGYEPREAESHPFQQEDAGHNENLQQSEKDIANQNWQNLAKESLNDDRVRVKQQNRGKQKKATTTSHVKSRNASSGNKNRHRFNLRNAVIYSEILNRRY